MGQRLPSLLKIGIYDHLGSPLTDLLIPTSVVPETTSFIDLASIMVHVIFKILSLREYIILLVLKDALG